MKWWWTALLLIIIPFMAYGFYFVDARPSRIVAEEIFDAHVRGDNEAARRRLCDRIEIRPDEWAETSPDNGRFWFLWNEVVYFADPAAGISQYADPEDRFHRYVRAGSGVSKGPWLLKLRWNGLRWKADGAWPLGERPFGKNPRWQVVDRLVPIG